MSTGHAQGGEQPHRLLEELRGLSLPIGDFAVFGSGPLFVRGWIEGAGDLDVLARGGARNRAQELGTLEHLEEWDVTVVNIGTDITVGTRWAIGEVDTDALIDAAELIDGLPFATSPEAHGYDQLERISEVVAAVGRWLTMGRNRSDQCNQTSATQATRRIEVDALLFDNDGVLVDSHRQVEQAWRQLAREFDLDVERILPEIVGVRAVDTLSRHLAPELVAAAVAHAEDLEVDFAKSTQPHAGAIDLIEQLPADRWAIVTSASTRLAEARWRGAGIKFPSTTVTADEVTEGKPSPEPFLTAARKLGVDPWRCVVFEDSPSGGGAGVAAGATVIAVGDQPWPLEPWARIADLSEVEVRHGSGAEVEVLLKD